MSLKNFFTNKKQNTKSSSEDFNTASIQQTDWDITEDSSNIEKPSNIDISSSLSLNSNTEESTVNPSTRDYEEELNDLYADERIKQASASEIEDNKDDERLNYSQVDYQTELSTNEEDLYGKKGTNEIPVLKKEEKEKKSAINLGGLFKKKQKKDLVSNLSALTQQEEMEEVEKPTISRKTTGSMSNSMMEGVGYKEKKLPIIGSFDTKFQYKILGSVFVLSLLGAISFGVVNQSANNKKAEAIRLSTKVLGDSQAFLNEFIGTTSNRENALEAMYKRWEELKTDLEKIKESNKNYSGSSLSEVNKMESSLDQNLKSIEAKINLIKKQEDLLKNTTKRLQSIQEQGSSILDLIDRVGIVYLQTGANQSEMNHVYSLKTNLQQILGLTSNLFYAEKINSDTPLLMSKSRKDFRETLADLYSGNKARGINPINYDSQAGSFDKLAHKWIKFADIIDLTLKRVPELIKIKDLAPQVQVEGSTVTKEVQSLLNFYNTNDYYLATISKIMILTFLLMLLISSILIFYVYSYEKDNKSLLEKLENSKNQNAILRLLNEIQPLQDGDLTQKATVTEEVTGAIADSINATVDSLSYLVRRVKDTSFKMREKANEVNEISLNMLRSTEEQSSSIQNTGESVIGISKAIQVISDKTKQTANKAKESAVVSTEGAQQVFASIETMQTINHNMNETGVLMKKVSDSSKQISEIVNLLSDITEETNILALNATVQAAKAGDAGKGFKIVADSIQELADKASDATRRVGALISAVQTDIQSVANSIDKTSEEVEKGVNLSENAGKSLQTIKEVSNQLAQIVETVSEDANKHAKISQEISKNMELLLMVTEKTKDSTEQTANSISEIADISNELGDSVQSFKVE